MHQQQQNIEIHSDNLIKLTLMHRHDFNAVKNIKLCNSSVQHSSQLEYANVDVIQTIEILTKKIRHYTCDFKTDQREARTMS
jgi:hypothetical protein